MSAHTAECAKAMYRGPRVCICGADPASPAAGRTDTPNGASVTPRTAAGLPDEETWLYKRGYERGRAEAAAAPPAADQIHDIWEATFDKRKAMQVTESHADLIEYAWAEGFKHGRAAAAPPAGIDVDVLEEALRLHSPLPNERTGNRRYEAVVVEYARLLAAK